jgi:hypothetical protein
LDRIDRESGERSGTMFDNMTGAVGFAMHEDRLARAIQNLRLAEAEQGARRGSSRRIIREVIAEMLLDLATRLTPVEDIQKPASAA